MRDMSYVFPSYLNYDVFFEKSHSVNHSVVALL